MQIFTAKTNTTTVNASSSASASAPLPTTGGSMRVYNEGTATAVIHISPTTALAGAPVAGTTTDGIVIAAGNTETFSIPKTQQNFSVIGSGLIYISVGEGA